MFASAYDVDLEELDQRTKLLACVEVTRLKMEEDQQLIEKIIDEATFEGAGIPDKIATEMLENCYVAIELSIAADILKAQSFELTDELRAIMSPKEPSFSSQKDTELTSSQIDLINKIEGVFEKSEQRKNQEEDFVKYNDFSNFDSFKLGPWYLFVVFGVFFGLVMLGAKKVLHKQVKATKKAKAKKLG